ncbi:hypothetical protein VMCG_03630 [Cytospora schulzeri]|uniref:Uncharacterized protein n=1 Tax=Cytospora schulzeri TaxID=448051 RepID=A0A423WW86_9PEZI|nr:hypothetical protein VMCG_03630 [Valsa malicola]
MRLSQHLFSIFLAQTAVLAASTPEAAPDADHHAPAIPFQEIGRYLKRVLGLETRDGITYYGDYGAYGDYGSYGTYPDSAAESSAVESSAQPTTTTTSTTTVTTSVTLSAATTSSTGLTEVSTAGLINKQQT